MLGQEGRAHHFRTAHFFIEGVDQIAPPEFFRMFFVQIDPLVFDGREQLRCGLELLDIDTTVLQNQIPEGHRPPLSPEIHFGLTELDLRGPECLLEHRLEEALHQVHIVAVVPICGIPFDHGELLKMIRTDTLVAVTPGKLEHMLESADHETLQVSLGCNP